MAQIYRARHQDTRVEVAIKVSLSESLDPTNKNALRREVDILTCLNHPGVIRVLPIPLKGAKEQPYMARAFTLSGQPWFYVMEYLQGGSLEGILREVKKIPLSLASAIGVRLADALAYIHGCGVAHLDVKPENVVVRCPLVKNATIEPVLIDFGVAAQTKQSNATGGTLITMSPEYIRKVRGELAPEQKIDFKRVDIYALGVVTYRMWTGQYPFRGITERSLTSAILHEAVQSPRAINPELPRQTEDLMMEWLAKDPFARPSLEEIRRELTYLTAGLTCVPQNIGTGITPKKRTSRWQFWRK
jgi:serine/threonine protein kinase